MTEIEKKTIDALCGAQDVDELWPVFLEEAHAAGFDHAIYGVNRVRFFGTFGEKLHSFALSDLPDNIQKVLWDEGLYRHVVAATWAISNSGSISLHEAARQVHHGEVTPEQHDAHFKMVELGVTSGIAIGFNKCGGTTVAGMGLVNLGKSHQELDEAWAVVGPRMETYARIFHMKMSCLPLPLTQLTERQRDVLRWAACGKTTAEIATILGLSQATIEKHLRQARDNLGASNTAQALLNAQAFVGLDET